MPDSASYITHSLMKDGVPSENSGVGINFVFVSKVKSKSKLTHVEFEFVNSQMLSFEKRKRNCSHMLALTLFSPSDLPLALQTCTPAVR